ncbi:glycosyltransferase family 2 protein [Salisediminibacterium beveridgei]|uniref:Putative glycosyl transferase n=1 Tax=Salisediminibacterium beveridgei TaxID=632773 RepID=A0A1D7QRN5_9BACI|nr:glycosyltransferase family 2 protein [Salisediminibacterium beveridgei]AOM81660.1 Putative glycosyl transferase [Salisediminibacterium beveridgei]
MKKLSIVIPHYNSSDSLVRLLNSIPVNDFIEIIIVDDRSSEEHVSVLKQLTEEFLNHHIKLFFNDVGEKSAGAARNIGLEHVTGEWILFADSDDFFTEGFYEVISQYFESDNDIVFFTPTSIYNDTNEVATRHTSYEELVQNYLSQPDWYSEARLRYGYDVPWSKLFRVSFIKTHLIEFDEVIYSNDVMFSLKAGFYAMEFEVSKDVIYCVTRDRGSLTSTVNEETFDIRLGVTIRKYIFLRENLPRKDFEKLELSGRGALMGARQFGLKKVLGVYRALRRHRIKIISLKIFNPMWFLDRYKRVRSKEKELEKYKI